MSKRTCEHIQDDGLRCSNPAMYRRQVCYHHWRLLRPSAPVCDPAYVPPTFDSEASVSICTANILRSLLAGKINPRLAQVAMTCVRETAKSMRRQGKVGDHIETSFTHFMADYYSTLDEIQQKSAAAYPDPQPLIYPAHFADIPEDDEPPVATAPAALSSRAPAHDLSSRARHLGEGSAFARTTTHTDASAPPMAHADPAAAAAPERVQPWVSVTSTSPAPAGAADKKPALSATQLKLMKKILRRGPSHPRFHDAARLLDRHIAAID